MRLVTIVQLCVVAVLLNACQSPGKPVATSITLGEQLSVVELAPDIWMHTTYHRMESGQSVVSQGLLLQRNGSLLLVDTPWGLDATRELLNWAEGKFGRVVSEAVFTHFHEDRMAGVAELKARGVSYYSHTLTRILWPDPTVRMPLSLDMMKVGDLKQWQGLELFYPGPGHSEDNIVVWIPDQQILFGGCLLRPTESSGLGDTADANLGYWPKAVARVQRRYPQPLLVVPAHGAASGGEIYQHNINLFQ